MNQQTKRITTISSSVFWEILVLESPMQSRMLGILRSKRDGSQASFKRHNRFIKCLNKLNSMQSLNINKLKWWKSAISYQTLAHRHKIARKKESRIMSNICRKDKRRNKMIVIRHKLIETTTCSTRIRRGLNGEVQGSRLGVKKKICKRHLD